MTRIDAPERVPDWLLGGRVRRRVLEKLDEAPGSTAREIADKIDAGEATVYEILRALTPLDALTRLGRGRYRLNRQSPVGRAIRALLRAGAPFADKAVDRPPGRVKN